MADFSADKLALQKILTTFDNGVKVEDVIGYPVKYDRHANYKQPKFSSFLLYTLLESCCSFVEPNPQRRKEICSKLEELLIREKILNPSIRFAGLAEIRNIASQNFIEYLKKVRSDLSLSQNDSSTVVLDADLPTFQKYPNTYEQNFEELKVIAEGGFGIVCMAVHKVDRQIYAVKKIIFDCDCEKDFTQVMSEVKSISSLSHRNIVSYKNCWIQLLNNLMEKERSTDGSSENLNSASRKSMGQKKKKPKCSTYLTFPGASGSLWTSPTSSKVSNSHEGDLLDDKSTSLAVLECNFDKTRISSNSINASTDSWICFENDITSPKLESYQSIKNSHPNVSTQSSISENVSSEDNSEHSSDSDSDPSIIFQDSFRGDSGQNIVTACANLKLESPVLNPDLESCWTSTPMHYRMPKLKNERSVIPCNFYTSDSALVSASSNLKTRGIWNITESANSSSSSVSESKTELDQCVIFHDSSRKDSPYTVDSILENGNFNRDVSVSCNKTSSRLANLSWDETPSGPNTDMTFSDSIGRNVVPDISWIFKRKLKAMLCIQMEYCNCDLRFWLDQRVKGDVLPFQKQVKDIFRDIVNGVAHFHSKSIIHRDLKPQNIFYSEKDDSMKIGDFGLATLGHSSPNRQRVVYQNFTSNLGTYPYAAPEQMKKCNYNNKVDCYSLGIILIELLHPFQTHSEFFQTIPLIVEGGMPKEISSRWPCYVDLLKNLVHINSQLRMSAKEILALPVMEDDTEVDKRQLLREIEELKKALKENDKVLKEKNSTIEKLRFEISQLKKAKSKKSRKKH